MKTLTETEVRTSDEVMQAVGELNESTKNLKSETQCRCKADPEEVGSWISVIGKALVSILK